MDDPNSERRDVARRNFLASCGKLAIATPPAITLLLSTSLDSPAVAASGGSGGCTLICRFLRNF